MSSRREKVEHRAKQRCEYCQAPQGICAYTFHVEHITPRSKGGTNTLSNYALACFPCNNAKSAHTTAIDPKTGAEVTLFHPRKHKWNAHFKWSKGFLRIEGKTPIGRAAVQRLKMNERLQSKARTLWVKTGIWP